MNPILVECNQRKYILWDVKPQMGYSIGVMVSAEGYSKGQVETHLLTDVKVLDFHPADEILESILKPGD